MSMKTLPGTPTERDIDLMVEQFGVDAVRCWLLIQIYHLKRKTNLLADHLKAQWTFTAGYYAARYQALLLREEEGDEHPGAD